MLHPCVWDSVIKIRQVGSSMEAQSGVQLTNHPEEISRSFERLLSPAGSLILSSAIGLGLWAEKFPIEALGGELCWVTSTEEV